MTLIRSRKVVGYTMSIFNRDSASIAWIHAKDFDHCAAIDLSSKEPLVEPWSQHDWRLYMRGDETKCLTAWAGLHLAGYLAYSSFERTISLDRMVVAHDKRRQGIGSTLLSQALRISIGRRTTSVVALLPEHWVAGQCFLRKHGFVYTQTLYAFCDGRQRDAYAFERQVGSQINEAAGCRGR